MAPLQFDGELTAYPYSIALATRFRGIDVREGMIIHGPAGYAEFSPFWDYGSEQCVPWLKAAIEAATAAPPPGRRASIPVNATVPAVVSEVAAGIVRESGGCQTVKVKVAGPGDCLESEQNRVAAVREALGPGGAIRIDANGAWDTDTAVARLERLDRAANGLQYAEQPCRTVAELAEVRRRSRVPIAADESIRCAADPLEVVRRRAADVVVLKVQPIGGVRACLELAERVDVPVVVSSALETSVGLGTGLALAAALPVLPFACGLATGTLLTADATRTPPRPRAGAIRVASVAVDALEAIAADAGSHAAWARRLAEVAELAGLPAGRIAVAGADAAARKGGRAGVPATPDMEVAGPAAGGLGRPDRSRSLRTPAAEVAGPAAGRGARRGP